MPFNFQAASLDEHRRISENIWNRVDDALDGEVSAIDRVAVLTGICQKALEELVKTHPKCPCGVIGSMTVWMGQCAQEHRFHHPFSAVALATPHNDDEGGQHDPHSS